jgi:hypothetical protein
MLNRLSLFTWLVELESLDTPPERESALRDGYELASLVVGDGLVPNDRQARLTIARLLADLEADGWIAWEWTRYAGDPHPEQPSAPTFDEDALRKVRHVRITPEGYSAFAARRRLDSDETGDREAREPDSAAEEPRYDLFISHASEDKDAVARPLAHSLKALGFSVWFDEDVLEVGDSLRRSIDAGLARSRYGVVVLSRAFFNKPWPPRELDGLFGREIVEGTEIILPLWHEIDQDFLAAEAPMLLGRLALRTDIGTAELADRLARRLRRERGEEDLRLRAAPLVRPPAPRVAHAAPQLENGEASRELSGVDARERLIGMLRTADPVGLRELLRHERRTFEATVLDRLREAADELQSSADPERLRPLDDALWHAVDRRLGSLLPLVEYRADALIDEVAALAELAGRSPATRSPYSAWVNGTRWPVWLVTLIVGTVALALDEPDAVLTLWDQRAWYDAGRPLPAARLGGGADLGQALARARGGNFVGPVELWYPAFAIYESELVRTYYDEILRGGDVPDSMLGFLSRAGDYLWLCGALAGRDHIEMIQFWSASQVHPTLPRRLDPDTKTTGRLAKALDLERADVAETLIDWLAEARGPRV